MLFRSHLNTGGGTIEITSRHFLKKLKKVEKYQKQFFEEVFGKDEKVINILKKQTKNSQSFMEIRMAYHKGVLQSIKEGEVIAHVPFFSFGTLDLFWGFGSGICDTMIGELKSDSKYIKLKERSLKEDWDHFSHFLSIYGPIYQNRK